jgi:hypothetical protein
LLARNISEVKMVIKVFIINTSIIYLIKSTEPRAFFIL